MTAFSVRLQVMFHHCDPAGIVFYPRYFEMINAVVERWFEERLEVPFHHLHGERNGAVPTVSLNVEFLHASHHGDDLDFVLTPTGLGRSSMTLSVEVTCQGQQRLTMQARLVYMKQATGRAEPWPGDLRQRLFEELNQAVTSHA